MLIAAYQPPFPPSRTHDVIDESEASDDVSRTARRNAAQGIKFRQGRQAPRSRKPYVFTALARSRRDAPKPHHDCAMPPRDTAVRPNCPESRNEPQQRLFPRALPASAARAGKKPL